MRRLLSLAVTLCLLAMNAVAEAPLAKPNQAWAVTLKEDAIKKIPVVPLHPRSAASPEITTGRVQDAETWRTLLQLDPKLAAIAPIDFAHEAIVAVIHNDNGGGEKLELVSFAKDTDAAWRIEAKSARATFMKYETWRHVILLRVSIGPVPEVRVAVNGAVIGNVRTSPPK